MKRRLHLLPGAVTSDAAGKPTRRPKPAKRMITTRRLQRTRNGDLLIIGDRGVVLILPDNGRDL